MVPTLYDPPLPPLSTADSTLFANQSYGTALQSAGESVSYGHDLRQPLVCFCGDVASIHDAAAILALAAEDTISVVRSLPAELPVDRRCEMVGRIRSLNAYLQRVLSYYYSIHIGVVC